MKKVLLAILLLVLVVAIVGYYLFNKKHFNVQDAKPVAEITAAALQQSFITDSAIAKNKFIGDEANQKVIQVNGGVSDVKTDQQGNSIILLATAVNGAFINCTMEGKAGNIKAGSNIVIKGICTGYNFDADMGIPGDVILTRCYLVK